MQYREGACKQSKRIHDKYPRATRHTSYIRNLRLQSISSYGTVDMSNTFEGTKVLSKVPSYFRTKVRRYESTKVRKYESTFVSIFEGIISISGSTCTRTAVHVLYVYTHSIIHYVYLFLFENTLYVTMVSLSSTRTCTDVHVLFHIPRVGLNIN
jgi:hypothetical protein